MDKTFYRYYPLTAEPFEISTDAKNKYGNGIYFLNNKDFYNDKFNDARLITIKEKLKKPFVITEHNNQIPNIEYIKMILPLYRSGEILNRGDFTEKLKKAGYDSLIIHEPKGIYLVMFENNPDNYEIISDISA